MSLFAFSNEAICVADEQNIAFYAPKTLKKFRVQSFTDHRVVGICIQPGTTNSVLHVVDVRGNYVRVDLKTITVVSSSTVYRTTEKKAVGSKPVLATKGPAKNKNETFTNILQAAFYQCAETFGQEELDGESELTGVLLTNEGVYEFSSSNPQSTTFLKYGFAKPLPGLIMDVGRHSGVVVVGQPGQKWVLAIPHGESKTVLSLQPMQLSVALASLACHPEEPSFAVGGQRGELLIFPDISESHHFSDHWHHTPLDAIVFSPDGASLYTGGSEGVLLTWSTHSYTFKKLGVHLGPIRHIVGNSQNGTQLLLPCAASSLALVNLLERRVEKSIEGVQWTAGRTCTGIVVTDWLGQEGVILTGLPDVIRVCDPVTQQAFFSLHVSTQLETVAPPADCGIRFVGVLNAGRLLISYEDYTYTSLPSVMRFWVFDEKQKRHVETQAIISPHNSPVLALCVDKARQRVFTLSRTHIKCWVEAEEDKNDATAELLEGNRRWKCLSTQATPSTRVSSMSMSDDGSVCMVSDDTVYLYGVSTVSPGMPWRLLTQLSQGVSVDALRNVTLHAATRTVSAHNADAAFVWALESGNVTVISASQAHSDSVSCACVKQSEGVLVCVFSSGAMQQWTLGTTIELLASVPAETVSRTTTHVQSLHGNRLAMLDSQAGYRTIAVQWTTKLVEVPQLSSSALPPSADEGDAPGLGRFFRSPNEDASAIAAKSSDASLDRHATTVAARTWLSDILTANPYVAPPTSSILSGFITQLSGL